MMEDKRITQHSFMDQVTDKLQKELLWKLNFNIILIYLHYLTQNGLLDGIIEIQPLILNIHFMGEMMMMISTLLMVYMDKVLLKCQKKLIWFWQVDMIK